MDRDNPSGVGDYEVTDSSTLPQYLPPCRSNYYVQAQVIGPNGPTGPIYNSADEVKCYLNQNVHFVVNRCLTYGIGMWCKNAENPPYPPDNCLDYRVRFCCGESNLI